MSIKALEYVMGPLFDATVGSVARHVYPISRPHDPDFSQAVQDASFFHHGFSLHMTLARYNQLSLSEKICKASTVHLAAGAFGTCTIGLPGLTTATYLYQVSWPIPATLFGLTWTQTLGAFAYFATEQYVPRLASQPPILMLAKARRVG